jgi:hypothetical protein
MSREPIARDDFAFTVFRAGTIEALPKVIKSFVGICQECWHWRVLRNPPDSVDDFDQASQGAISRFDAAGQIVSNGLPSKIWVLALRMAFSEL